jgi:hypothetical protein
VSESTVAKNERLNMQPKGWINLFFWIVLAYSSAILFYIKKVDAAQAANTDLSMTEDDPISRITSLEVAWIPAQLCQECGQISRKEIKKINFAKEVGRSQEKEGMSSSSFASTNYPANTYDDISNLYSQTPPDQTPPPLSTPEQNLLPIPEVNQIPTPPTSTPPTPTPPTPAPPTPAPPTPAPPTPARSAPTPPLPSTSDNLPQLEGQPADFPQPSSPAIEQRLQLPETDYAQRVDRLRQLLQEKKPAPTEVSDLEIGKLIVRQKPLEQQQPPKRPEPPKTIGYLQAHVGYFHTNNIFSSTVAPIEDGLIYSGLTLASMPIRLGNRTFLNGSIDGNLMRYINQSKYNYNQVRFNVSIFQQLSSQMYGEIGWSNQQLFYARNGTNFSAGDRFLNEDSFRLSLGRRDPLTSRLMLDSFYELRLSLTDPPSKQDNRDRLIHSAWISLNYYLEQSLQIGLDYQFGLSNFTERQREDIYHRFYGHFTYGLSNYTNLSVQGGITLGGSTDRNIDVDGWFFSINYNLELGRF